MSSWHQWADTYSAAPRDEQHRLWSSLTPEQQAEAARVLEAREAKRQELAARTSARNRRAAARIAIAGALAILAFFAWSVTVGGESMAGGLFAAFSIGAVLLGMLVGVGLYLLPTVVAHDRGHHQLGAIAAINVLFGWTLLGWGVAMVLAMSATGRR